MLALAVTAIGYLAFLVLSIKLTIVDAREHRLPNKLVALSAAIGVATIAITALLTADPQLLLRGLTCAAGAFAVYLALHLLSRTKNGAGLGAGDVKLSAVLGLYLGWVSVDAAVLGIASGFVLGALFSLALIAIRRGNRRTKVAFGPWMLAGAWLVIAVVAANGASGLPDLLNSHYS
jgi:leader peptidase (prepilin peptidase)/N-methyltransferase